jgi:predicted RNase H-like nuclease (RuvC/YqgF family)
MSRETLKGLAKEENLLAEIRDTKLNIKDVEAELEHMELREPDEYKYIHNLKAEIYNLEQKLDKLYQEYETY